MCTSDLPPSHKQFEGKKKKSNIHLYMHIEDQEINLE